MSIGQRFDVAVVGGGPVGCITALGYARRGARVALIEANPNAHKRLAGEWLHPPAAEALAEIGVGLPPTAPPDSGQGFVVFPDDGEGTIVLPYPADGVRGFAVEHHELVEHLRDATVGHGGVTYMPGHRVTQVQRGKLEVKRRTGMSRSLNTDLIVGADGRASIVRKTLGLPMDHRLCSRMAGLLFRGIDVPFEGYGHVFLGGPGPVLMYRIGDDVVRMIIDVPLGKRGVEYLWDAYHAVLPESLRGPFKAELLAGRVQWAANQVRPRTGYGADGIVLAGDAIGHYHPLTAVGMTLGFTDAIALPKARNRRVWELQRRRWTRVPEMLAVVLYEVFADDSPDAMAIRKAVYDLWRRVPVERTRTMRFLAGQDRRLAPFSSSFVKATGLALERLARRGFEGQHWREVAGVTSSLAGRIKWLAGGMLHLMAPTRTTRQDASKPQPQKDSAYMSAVRAGAGRPDIVDLKSRRASADPEVSKAALSRGVDALVRHQAEDGSWEGEVVWCALLPAQYVLGFTLMGQELSEEDRNRVLQQFRVTQLPDGCWGLHEHDDANLFVTSLVYVAARILGVGADDTLLTGARRLFAEGEGVVAIPSWGKFWLALMNLYSWDGVNPVLPEIWTLPSQLPIHPSQYYCHTRLIYMGMAGLYGLKLSHPMTDFIRTLRNELYPNVDYSQVQWTKARGKLREGDLYQAPSKALKLAYKVSGLYERVHSLDLRKKLLSDIRERVRWELKTTDHTSISPVSGMLNLLTLWAFDPQDPVYLDGIRQFRGWIWSDDTDGLRVAGARSATWDSSFALQALAAASRAGVRHDEGLSHGDSWLKTQQIDHSFPGYADNDRIDPKGGFCFAGVWHGWPVSDCTAEATEALMDVAAAMDADLPRQQLLDGARFILRAQGKDGGFGSYEARRSSISLEWMNPAEMFGDSMTENAYTECTASCVSALAAIKQKVPGVLDAEIDHAVAKANRRLRARQLEDGSWEGSWGVNYVYGTLFGIRGLRAAGARATDPAVKRAVAWLLERQRPDGGWGEHWQGCLTGQYEQDDHSQVIQTAWALMGLHMGGCHDWDAMDRAAGYLASMQGEDGEWPKEEMAGIFFRTALLDYVLYRRFFPVWALGLHHERRAERLPVGKAQTSRRTKKAAG